WGEVLIANNLAQALSTKLGINLTKATAMVTHDRQQGMGWGQIAHANGLNLGGLVSRVEKSANAVAATKKTAQGGVHGFSSAGVGPGHSRSSGGSGIGGGGGNQGGRGGQGNDTGRAKRCDGRASRGNFVLHRPGLSDTEPPGPTG